MAGVFDVEVVIAELLADPNRTSVELPCWLNAEQRKYVKEVADQHAEIKSESFGLGKERRIHLFKIGDSTPQRVSVKNTFIDDWIDASGLPADSRAVQSMPHNMFGQCLATERSAHTSTAAEEESSDLPATPTVSKEVTSAESDPVANSSVSGRRIWWSDMVEDAEIFAVGTEVIIDGLTKAPSFNGSHAIVQSWDAETGRYNLLLSAATMGGQRLVKVKGENLREAEQRPFFHPSML